MLFTGSVQGVGFRATAVHLSQGYDVVGYVRNLRDGRVELVAEGTPTELFAFQERITDHFRHHIRGVEVTESPASGDFSGFRIQH